MTEQLEAAHPRHHQICQHQLAGLALEELEGGDAVLGDAHLPPLLPQGVGERDPEDGLVLGDEHPAEGSGHGEASALAAAGAAGSTTRKSEPLPASLSRSMVPPWAATIP